jgi:DNA-binding transcriptional ArsR family regulator
MIRNEFVLLAVASHFRRGVASMPPVRLRESGLAEERRVGTRRLYQARPERLAETRAFLESFWDQSLAAIKQSAEAATWATPPRWRL